MSQYNAGTVTVTNASASVVGVGTLWSGNVAAGNLFSIMGSSVPYIVGSVTDNTHLTLSSNYAGPTASTQPYAITTSFTSNNSLPYPEDHDIDTATILKRAMLLIDTIFAALTGSATQLFKALTFIASYTTTATAAGTTVLTSASTQQQFFTGTTTQTVTMPVTSTLILGQTYLIANNSTGSITVNSSGGNLIATVPALTKGLFTCTLTSGTTAASWHTNISALLNGDATQTFSVAAATAAAHAVRKDQITVTAAIPAFQVSCSSASTGRTSGVTYQTQYDTEAFDALNNFTASVFTAPIAGYYQFNFTAIANAVTTLTAVVIAIRKNSGAVLGTYNGVAMGAGAVSSTHLSGMIQLAVNDTVDTTITIVGTGTLTDGAATINTNYFSGFLVRAL